MPKKNAIILFYHAKKNKSTEPPAIVQKSPKLCLISNFRRNQKPVIECCKQAGINVIKTIYIKDPNDPDTEKMVLDTINGQQPLSVIIEEYVFSSPDCYLVMKLLGYLQRVNAIRTVYLFCAKTRLNKNGKLEVYRYYLKNTEAFRDNLTNDLIARGTHYQKIWHEDSLRNFKTTINEHILRVA